MSTQPTPTSRYELARIKDTAMRTIQVLNEQRTIKDVLEHVDNGLLTEAEAWRLVSGSQIIEHIDKYGLYRGA